MSAIGREESQPAPVVMDGSDYGDVGQVRATGVRIVRREAFSNRSIRAAEDEQRARGFRERAGHDQFTAALRITHFLQMRWPERRPLVDEVVDDVVLQSEVRHGARFLILSAGLNRQ